jgi:hypothetical protein
LEDAVLEASMVQIKATEKLVADADKQKVIFLFYENRLLLSRIFTLLLSTYSLNLGFLKTIMLIPAFL